MLHLCRLCARLASARFRPRLSSFHLSLLCSISCYLMLSHAASFHLTTPHHTSPNRTPSHLTPPHHTSPHLTQPHPRLRLLRRCHALFGSLLRFHDPGLSRALGEAMQRCRGGGGGGGRGEGRGGGGGGEGSGGGQEWSQPPLAGGILPEAWLLLGFCSDSAPPDAVLALFDHVL